MHTETAFSILFDGRPIPARDGQSVAETLLENGIRTFRRTRSGEPRGPYCNMGVCFECRMIIDGRPNSRSCMTLSRPGMRVETQNDAHIEVPDEDC